MTLDSLGLSKLEYGLRSKNFTLMRSMALPLIGTIGSDIRPSFPLCFVVWSIPRGQSGPTTFFGKVEDI